MCSSLQKTPLPSDSKHFTLHNGDRQQLVCSTDATTDRTQFMPEKWVKTAIVIRCMGLMEGKSAVRIEVIKTMLQLLEHQIIPLIPLRGTISASGDLMPLAYIAAAMQGRPDILVTLGKQGHRVCTAQEGLRSYNMIPMQFQPKAALGMANGTSVSLAAGISVFHQITSLTYLALLMTAMATDALRGNLLNYDPLLFPALDHDGMRQVACLIRAGLEGSSLVRTKGSSYELGLHQDRYSLRTVPQWLGPALQETYFAEVQLKNELKSISDNPLIFPSTEKDKPGKIVYGGNFQATRVTTAMEKLRLAILLVGRMIFAQSSEIIDSSMNNGLPPNLAADNPSLSFTAKGIDINMAAYMSELCLKCNGSVLAGMQNAEMHNQNLNSLALLAARMADEGIAILHKMCASYLWVLCQALDLRALNKQFLLTMKIIVAGQVRQSFKVARTQPGPYGHDAFTDVIYNAMNERWQVNSNLDLEQRCHDTVSAATTVITAFLLQNDRTYKPSHENGDITPGFDSRSMDKGPPVLEQIRSFSGEIATTLAETYSDLRSDMFLKHKTMTPASLGNGSRLLYDFVRHDLSIPMHRGFVEAWKPKQIEANSAEADAHSPTTGPDTFSNIGIQITQIHAAIENGRCAEVVNGFLEPHLRAFRGPDPDPAQIDWENGSK